MSLFRDAKSITDAEMFYKVLAYGPRGTGKTHFALGWPEPAVLDLENRAHHFRTLFDFKLAGLETIESVREGFREILRGHVACKSIIIDSNSAMYQRLVDKYTSPNKDGKPVTDYVLVNKDMLAFSGFTFAIAGKNVIILAHQVDKLIRNGNQFQKDGVKGKYDSQIEYGFDFILRFGFEGKQRVAHVEKSIYEAQLPVGSVLRNPSYESLLAAIKDVQRPERQSSPSSSAATAPAPADHSNGTPHHGNSQEQRAQVSPDNAIMQRQLTAIAAICNHRGIAIPAGVEDLNQDERAALIRSLQKDGAA